MPYSTIADKKQKLIRKALTGSAFVAPESADAITALTAYTAGKTVINTTLSSASIVGATTISVAATIPAGRSIVIGAGAGAETVVTAGAPSGSGPYSIPVPALAKAHASGDAVVATAVPAVIDLAPLPTGYEDAGYMTSSGVVLAKSVTTSETSSWGASESTRSDITKETTTAQVVLQETKALAIGLYTSVDPSTVTPAVNTGEVSISRPVVPSNLHYRVLALAVDNSEAGEIYVARFLPNCTVTGKGNQPLTLQDDGITWDITFTAFEDETLGYSERFIFGGPGWQALAAENGF